jgi:hypothetical protein
MAVHAHAPRSEDIPVGALNGPAAGRPPYNAAPPSSGVLWGQVHRPCAGLKSMGDPCQRGSLWLLPEADYCAHHVPYKLLGIVLARRQLWIELAGDLWREVMAAEPVPEEECFEEVTP